MKINNKLLILIVIVILAVVFFLILPGLVKSRKTEDIAITQIRSGYSTSESIIVAGKTKENSEITLFFDNKVGLTKADASGKWKINLGSLKKGDYNFQVVANISNVKDSTATAKIVVKDKFGVSFLSGRNFFAGLANIFSEDPEQIKLFNKKPR